MNSNDSWVIGRLLADLEVNGELAQVSSRFATVAKRMVVLPVPDRLHFWEGFRIGQHDADLIALKVACADLAGSPGDSEEPPRRAARGGDVRKSMESTPWSWESWIPASSIFGLGGLEGTGKTRTLMDLHRRVFHGLPWPDGSPATLEPGRPILWLCGDNQQTELVEMLEAFGLPDDSLVFPTFSDDPFGGCSIDEAEIMRPGGVIDEVIEETKPWTMAIDSLTSSTSRNLCEQHVMKGLTEPLKRICQEHKIPIGLILHLSREGFALGRRIRGMTRTLLKLENPDLEEGDGRLRLWVDKSYSKYPMRDGKKVVLGVTMGDGGNEYDNYPPAKAEAVRNGRPPDKVNEAMRFLVDELGNENNQRWTDLRDRFEGQGGAPSTFNRAVDQLKKDGRLRTSGGRRKDGGDGTPLVLFLDPRVPDPSCSTKTPPGGGF